MTRIETIRHWWLSITAIVTDKTTPARLRVGHAADYFWSFVLCRPSRFWYQRATRGWDDTETWDLGNTTWGQWMHPRLVRYKEVCQGYPGGLHDEDFPEHEHGEATWQAMIDDMIYAFDSLAHDGEFHVGPGPYDYEKFDEERTSRGLALWAEWHMAVWW